MPGTDPGEERVVPAVVTPALPDLRFGTIQMEGVFGTLSGCRCPRCLHGPEYAARSVHQAHARATEVLLRFLDQDQRASYAKDMSFVVVGSHGNRYRIRYGSDHNILYLGRRGAATCELCAVPRMQFGRWPIPLIQLAQAFELRTNEARFLDVANCLGAMPVIDST